MITMHEVAERMYNDIHSGFYCQDCDSMVKVFSGSSEEPPEYECVCKIANECPYYIDKMEGQNA